MVTPCFRQHVLSLFGMLTILCLVSVACSAGPLGTPRATTPSDTSPGMLDAHVSLNHSADQPTISLSIQFFTQQIPVIFAHGESVQCDSIVFTPISNGGYKDEFDSHTIPVGNAGYDCIYLTPVKDYAFHLPTLPELTIITPQQGAVVQRQDQITVTFTGPTHGNVQARAGNYAPTSGGAAPTTTTGINAIFAAYGGAPATTGSVSLSNGRRLQPGSGVIILGYADQSQLTDSPFHSLRMDLQGDTQTLVTWG